MKNSNDSNRNRTRDLPACSAVGYGTQWHRNGTKSSLPFQYTCLLDLCTERDTARRFCQLRRQEQLPLFLPTLVQRVAIQIPQPKHTHKCLRVYEELKLPSATSPACKSWDQVLSSKKSFGFVQRNQCQLSCLGVKGDQKQERKTNCTTVSN